MGPRAADRDPRGRTRWGSGRCSGSSSATSGSTTSRCIEDAPETHRDLARIALFDYVANNTDRKSGHVLRGDDGRVWGIDHGLCFSAAFKLRTVIWDFAGEPIPDALLEDIAPLAEAVPPEVAELLDDDEVTALQRRVQRLLHARVLPVDRTGMRYPWPLV